MTNTQRIENFYAAFARGDAEGMIAQYHEDVAFADPAFGQLRGDRARAMWRMLLSAGASPRISYRDVQASGNTGSAKWTAAYAFGPQKRPVVNEITASFEFADGKIIRHTDEFDLWKWSSQALGLPGKLLGWSPFMRNKIRKTTNERLAKFMAEQ